MGKQTKLLKTFKQKKTPIISKFNSFANQIYHSKQKKAEKIHETKQRILAKKGVYGRIPKNKKNHKFALLDDQNDNIDHLTMKHRGKSIAEIQNFNDMHFGQQSSIEQLKQVEDEQRFFQPTNKSKKQVYKQIIQKSKQHKQQRQQQYEQNYEAAVQLDNNLQELLPKLKFLTPGKKNEQKIENRDLEYERLLKSLQNDEKIVPQKNLEKKKKQTERYRIKKNEQLKKLLKDDSDENIREWAQQQANGSEEEEDELDNVELSSSDEGEDDQQIQSDQQQDDSNQCSHDQQESQQSQQSPEIIITKNELPTKKIKKN